MQAEGYHTGAGSAYPDIQRLHNLLDMASV